MAKLVPAGVTLRDQVNRKWPKRDKRSDGWIGDSAHAARKSDHNPDSKGWVHAIDLDENFGKGVWRNGRAAKQFADQVIKYAASGLPGSDRVKYVVYENQIASGTYKSTWWKWRGRGYGHTAHIHVSFKSGAPAQNRAPFPLPILAPNLTVKRAWAKALG